MTIIWILEMYKERWIDFIMKETMETALDMEAKDIGFEVRNVDELIALGSQKLDSFLDTFMGEIRAFIHSNVESRDKFLKTLKTITNLPDDDERFLLSIIWLLINTSLYYKKKDEAALNRVKDEFNEVMSEYQISFTWQNLVCIVKIVIFAKSKLKSKKVFKCCLKDAFKCCKKKK